MKRKDILMLALIGLLLLWPVAVPAAPQDQQKPTVQVPEPGVPQMMLMEGKFVRIAYNAEGFVTLGYQLANSSVGEEWMLLEMGAALMDKMPDYTLRPENITLSTPDGGTVALPTLQEFRAAHLQGLENRAKVVRDSINYFPPTVHDVGRLGFYPELNDRGMPLEKAELSSRRACLGRVFFKVPGGIQYGQHFLNVKYEKSLVRVPFRILTKEEEKYLQKNFKDLSKQLEEAFKKK